MNIGVFDMKTRFLFLFLSILPFSGFSQTRETHLSQCDSLGICPDFKFYNLQGQVFNRDSLQKGMHRIVLIYFSTSCEFCLSEFKIIKKNMAQFSKTSFILISTEETADLRKYDSLRQFAYFPQIRIVQDKNHLYHKYFTAHYTPSVHIYDKKGKLLHFSDGKMTKEELTGYLEK